MAELNNVVLGAVAGTLFDMFDAIPLDMAGLLQAWTISDGRGDYVWGIGTGDVLTVGVGVGLYAAGLKHFGIGWLLSLGVVKLAEVGSYIWWNMYKGMRLVPTPITASAPVATKRPTGFMPRLTRMRSR